MHVHESDIFFSPRIDQMQFKLQAVTSNKRVLQKVSRNPSAHVASLFDKFAGFQQVARQRLDESINSIRKLTSTSAQFEQVRESMLRQLGAVEVHDSGSDRFGMYFIEVDEAESDMLYLCHSDCLRHSPMETWNSERVLGFSRRAFERLLKRDGKLLKAGVNAHALSTMLIGIYTAYGRYLACYGQKLKAAYTSNYQCAISVNQHEWFVQDAECGLPMINSVVNSYACCKAIKISMKSLANPFARARLSMTIQPDSLVKGEPEEWIFLASS